MRLSCNGCRVLRKGCSESCSIRPCLQWIKSPEAQSNATVFLAKFYGRAGLLNLINAAAEDKLRPAVFRSLLYEACGRIVNPVYGSVGLLWSGKWHMCQAAVEAVLKGAPIVTVSDQDAAAAEHLLLPNHNQADIRHVGASDHNTKKRKSPHSTSCSNNNNKKQQSSHADHLPLQDRNTDVSLDSDDDAEAASHVSQAQHNQQHETPPIEEEDSHSHSALGLDLTLGLFAAPPTAAAGETTQSTTAAEPQPDFLGLRFL